MSKEKDKELFEELIISLKKRFPQGYTALLAVQGFDTGRILVMTNAEDPKQFVIDAVINPRELMDTTNMQGNSEIN